MKRHVLILGLLLLLSVLATGCSKKEAKPKSNDKDINLNTLAEQLTKAAGELPDMEQASSEDAAAKDTFTVLCNLNYDMVDSYYISYASEAAADEIFLIKLKDENDIDTAKSALKDRLDDRRAAFNAYLPTEVTKVDEAEIAISGRYIALLICPMSKRTKETFQNCFK